MDKLKNFIVNDALSYLGGISLTAALIAIAYFLFKLASQHVFNKNIAKYKGQINEELEALKLQHQKSFKDFELFVSKKHEKYPQLFFLIEEAYGQVMSLRGFNRTLTFQNVDEIDLRVYLEELNLTNFDKERIISVWNDDQESGIAEIRSIEPRAKYEIARQKWLEANNYQIYNVLFFSDEVSHQSKILLNNLFDYMNSLEPGYVFSPEGTQENTLLQNRVLPADRKNLKNVMRKELSSLPL